MTQVRFYLLAILLHLAVLFWAYPSADNAPPKEKKKYLEVTLSTEPGPAKPGPDSGPGGQAKSAAVPGPIVADSPPPVSAIAPEPTPPPPELLPPEPEVLPPPPPPMPEPPPPIPAVEPEPVAAPPITQMKVEPVAPATNAPAVSPSNNPSSGYSAAPVSGTGQGNAAQWLPGSGGNGHFYRAFCVPDGITWANANKYANEHGGYLVTIISAAENAFVFKLVDDPKYWIDDSNPYYDGPWLGGYKLPSARTGPEGWRWVHGEGTFTYANWAPPNPNNGDGYTREDALNFWSGNGPVRQPRWNDRSGSRAVRGFVMEYDSEQAYLDGHPEIDPFGRKAPARPPPAPYVHR